MGGNQNHHNQHYVRNDDPFAKVKFSIPPFNGSYDAEAYLDWEMTIEPKFSSHLVPEQHRVRQATSEFKDFALIWWNELATLGLQPHTWDGFKIAMRQRFVPPSYQHDLRKKLQRLDQGDMSIPLTMPPRKQPPQQDPEEEDDDLVTGKQFKEMMHMMESLTAYMNETFNKTTTPMNDMLHKSQASTETTLEHMQRGIAAMAD
jgi:hypothetical protein